MPGQLLTLPVRLWIRGARVAVHVAEDVTERALTETLRVAGMLGALRPGGQDAPAPATPTPTPTPTATATTSPTPTAAPARPDHPRPARPQPARPPAPQPRPQTNGTGQSTVGPSRAETGTVEPPPAEPGTVEPTHVSEEPVLVREEAEPGAEEGAGASVNVREPWDGYGKLSARDVVDRLTGATAAEIAAVQLYEMAHRSRQTVLQAAERQLKSAGH